MGLKINLKCNVIIRPELLEAEASKTLEYFKVFGKHPVFVYYKFQLLMGLKMNSKCKFSLLNNFFPLSVIVCPKPRPRSGCR